MNQTFWERNGTTPKRLCFAIPMALLMSPVLITGAAVFHIKKYFVAGLDLGELIDEAIEEWLDK